MDETPQLLTCSVCKGPLSSKAKVCPHCGHPFADVLRREKRKETTTAIKNHLNKTTKTASVMIIQAGLFIAKVVAVCLGIGVAVGIGFGLFLQIFILQKSASNNGATALIALCAFLPVCFHLPSIYLSKALFGAKTAVIINRFLIVLTGAGAIVIAEPFKSILWESALFGPPVFSARIFVAYLGCITILLGWTIFLVVLSKKHGSKLLQHQKPNNRVFVKFARSLNVTAVGFLICLSIVFAAYCFLISLSMLRYPISARATGETQTTSVLCHFLESVEQDIAPVLSLKRKAAFGNVVAQFLLGQWYVREFSNHESNEKAARLFLMAAMSGHADSQYQIGCCYIEGRGVPCDPHQACSWFHKASKQGQNQALCVIENYTVLNKSLNAHAESFEQIIQRNYELSRGILPRQTSNIPSNSYSTNIGQDVYERSVKMAHFRDALSSNPDANIPDWKIHLALPTLSGGTLVPVNEERNALRKWLEFYNRADFSFPPQ